MAEGVRGQIELDRVRSPRHVESLQSPDRARTFAATAVRDEVVLAEEEERGRLHEIEGERPALRRVKLGLAQRTGTSKVPGVFPAARSLGRKMPRRQRSTISTGGYASLRSQRRATFPFDLKDHDHD